MVLLFFDGFYMMVLNVVVEFVMWMCVMLGCWVRWVLVVGFLWMMWRNLGLMRVVRVCLYIGMSGFCVGFILSSVVWLWVSSL